MSKKVSTKTVGDSFASIGFERALLELSKDEDSPACPRSWTWAMWFDGNCLDSTCDEESFSRSVRGATVAISGIIHELEEVRDYLTAYGVFCWDPDEEEVDA